MANKGSAKKASATPSTSSRCQPCYQSRGHKLATLFVMTAGSANATQFPMMFIAYGGAPFLLAYLAFLGVVTFPIMRLESNLAQFAGDGNRGIFSTVPLFLGVGYSMTAYAVIHAVADIAPLSDALALLLSWTRSFEWHHDCPGGWMTRNFTCYTIRRGSTPCKVVRQHLANSLRHSTLTEGMPVAIGSEVLLVDARTYKEEAETCILDLPDTASPYDFRRPSIWEQSSYDVSRAEPIFAVAAIWVLVFAIAHRGIIKLKVLFYGIIILHALTTLMLLARAFFLSGSTSGLRMFLHSNWASTANLEMWINALYTSLESVGVTGTIYLGIERLNCFKNRFQEDVMFVLVVDTASKGIGTIVSFLFLGHLSDSTGINVHMLVHADFNFIVSITPQAVSLGSYPEFWSRVHSLWVVSMMLPKFLIMPDIIMEVLSACHPPVLVNRRMAHFFICGFLFFLSMALSAPGGAKVFSILSHSQNALRFFLLALEVIVIVQFYGAKRLAIDSRLMTNEEPGFFVKLCWTSVIPVILVALVSAKLLSLPLQDRRYPPLLNMLIVWVPALELSFIPVCAVVFVLCTKLSFGECLLPLPTWVPVSWEQVMQYRFQLVAEDTNLQTLASPASERLEPEPLPRPSSPSPQPRVESPTQSSSDMLGTHLILTSEAKNSPSTSDWRYDSSEERDGKPPVKWRSPEKVVPDSGTFHMSRPLSAVWRSVKAKVHRTPALPTSPREAAQKAAGTTQDHAASPSAAVSPPPLPLPPRASDAGQHQATLSSPPGEYAGSAASPVRSDADLPHVQCEDVPRDTSQKHPDTRSPVGSTVHEHLNVESRSSPQKQQQPAPVEPPSLTLPPHATMVVEEKGLPQGDEVRAPEMLSLSELPVYSTAQRDQSNGPNEEQRVAEAGPGNNADHIPASLSGRSPSALQESAALPSLPTNSLGLEQHEISSPVPQRGETDALPELEMRREGRQESPESLKSPKKETTSPQRKNIRGSPRSRRSAEDAQTAGEHVAPDVQSPAPHPLAKQPHRKRPHGHKSPAKRSKKGLSASPSPDNFPLSPASPVDVKSPAQSFAPSSASDEKCAAPEKALETDGLSPEVGLSPRRRKATEKKPSAATVADKKPEAAAAASGKAQSPARKTHRRKGETASPTPKAPEKKLPSRKAAQAQPSTEGNTAATSPTVFSPRLKSTEGKAESHKATSMRDKENPLTSPLTTGAYHIANEAEKPNRAPDDLLRSPSPVGSKSPERQRKRTTGKEPGSPKGDRHSDAVCGRTQPVPGKDSAALLSPSDHSPAKAKSPHVPVASAQTVHGPSEPPHIASAAVTAMDETGSGGVSKAQGQAEAAKKTDPRATEHRGDRLLRHESDRGGSAFSPGTDNIGSHAAGQTEDRAEAAKGSDGKARSDRPPKKEDDQAGKKGVPREPGARNAKTKSHHKGSHRAK